MPFSGLQNCCLEAAIVLALKKYYPETQVAFNFNRNAQNDNQIGFGQIANLSPGMNLTTYDLSLARKSKLHTFFKSLNKASIYFSRIGQNNGSGHFAALRFENGYWWEFNGQSTTQVTDDHGNVIEEFWGTKYKCLNTGPGNSQYSLNLYELSLPRIFLAMNFVAEVRQSDSQSEINEFMAAESIEEQLKQGDEVFLEVSPKAKAYWKIEPEIKLTEEEVRAIQLDYYRFQLIKKNEPGFLDKYQQLKPQFQEDFPDLLHESIDAEAYKTIDALLSRFNFDFRQQETYLDTLFDKFKEENNISKWNALKRPFQFKRMQIAINSGLPLKPEMLLDACLFNSEKAIQYFFEQKDSNDILKQDGLAQKLIGQLLQTKKNMDTTWDTMKDTIFFIVEKILAHCPPDVTDEVIQQLQRDGLTEDIKEGKQLAKLIKHHRPEAAAPQDEFERDLQAIAEQYDGFLLTVPLTTLEQVEKHYNQCLGSLNTILKKYPKRQDEIYQLLNNCYRKSLQDEGVSEIVKNYIRKLLASKQIQKKDLMLILRDYRPKSWTGWILYVLSFGTHQSETVRALHDYINTNPEQDSFTLQELKTAISRESNTDSQKAHRIGLFEGLEKANDSGTDKVLRSIIRNSY